MTISTNELRENRKHLIDQLAAFDGKILRGSVIVSYRKCGKPRCKCVIGTGHGPKYSMTVNFPKRKPENIYIPLEYVEQVKALVYNYQQFKEIIEQICMINQELLKRRVEL